MRRKSFICLLAICLLFVSFPERASAATAASFVPGLSFSGNTASCSVEIKHRGKQISATMALWHGSTCVDTWSDTATSVLTMSETHSGCVSGWTYTLKINGTIGGVTFSEITVTATC